MINQDIIQRLFKSTENLCTCTMCMSTITAINDAANEIQRLRELADDMAQHLLSYLCHCKMSKCKCGYDSVMEHYEEVRGER